MKSVNCTATASLKGWLHTHSRTAAGKYTHSCTQTTHTHTHSLWWNDARVWVSQLLKHGLNLCVCCPAVVAVVCSHHVCLQLIWPVVAVECVIHKGVTCRSHPNHSRLYIRATVARIAGQYGCNSAVRLLDVWQDSINLGCRYSPALMHCIAAASQLAWTGHCFDMWSDSMRPDRYVKHQCVVASAAVRVVNLPTMLHASKRVCCA